MIDCELPVNLRLKSIYINSCNQVEDVKKARIYSEMDLFPTTIASLGFKIEGNRLGLGTNLFSKEETLLEKYG